MHKGLEGGAEFGGRAPYALSYRAYLTPVWGEHDDNTVGFGEFIGAQNNPVGPVTLGYIVAGSTGFFTRCLIQLLLQPSCRGCTGSPQR